MAVDWIWEWRSQAAGGGVLALLVYPVLVLLPVLLAPAILAGLGAGPAAIQLTRPIAYFMGCIACAGVGFLLSKSVPWAFIFGALIPPAGLGMPSLLLVTFGAGIPAFLTAPVLSMAAGGLGLTLGYAFGRHRHALSGQHGRAA